jgi:hypothetical protein
MKGIVRFRSRQGHHVVIETEDRDYAAVHAYSAELRVGDTVVGDLVNPGKKTLRRPSQPPVAIFLEGCRMRQELAKEWIAEIDSLCDV